MNDEEYELEKSRISSYLNKWFTLLNLTEWRKISFQWFREGKTDDWASQTAMMEVTTNWPYRDAWIKIDMTATRHEDNSEIEHIVVHELCHILVAEMNHGRVTVHEERVVTELSRAFRKTYEEAYNRGAADYGPAD